jgi:hypothetical protein
MLSLRDAAAALGLSHRQTQRLVKLMAVPVVVTTSGFLLRPVDLRLLQIARQKKVNHAR